MLYSIGDDIDLGKCVTTVKFLYWLPKKEHRRFKAKTDGKYRTTDCVICCGDFDMPTNSSGLFTTIDEAKKECEAYTERVRVYQGWPKRKGPRKEIRVFAYGQG